MLPEFKDFGDFRNACRDAVVEAYVRVKTDYLYNFYGERLESINFTFVGFIPSKGPVFSNYTAFDFSRPMNRKTGSCQLMFRSPAAPDDDRTLLELESTGTLAAKSAFDSEVLKFCSRALIADYLGRGFPVYIYSGSIICRESVPTWQRKIVAATNHTPEGYRTVLNIKENDGRWIKVSDSIKKIKPFKSCWLDYKLERVSLQILGLN